MQKKFYGKFIVSEDYKLLVYAVGIDAILSWFLYKFDPLRIANIYGSPFL